MRVRQVVGEALLGLRRNLVMSVAAVLTVAVSLAFVGAALLVIRTTDQIRGIFYTQIEISIFLTNDVTPAQRAQIPAVLQSIPLVESVIYESKAEAYRRFRLQSQDQPELLANVTEDALPESYRVKLTDPEQYEVVASAVRDLPGVDEVVDYRKYLKPLFTTLNGLQTAALYVAAVQLFAATLLIANTVRVTAFSRRRETGVMRLVGATRLYIQLPFLLEGVLAGVLGAALGVGLMLLGKVALLDRGLQLLFSEGIIPRISVHDILLQAPWLFLLGVAISGLASLVTLQRYLRV